MRMTISKKLGSGFGVLILLIAVVAVVTTVQLRSMSHLQNQVVEVRFPSSQASEQLLNGMNHSLAALRGYMILGSNPAKGAFFKKDRQAAWEEIEGALSELGRLSKLWGVPQDITRLRELEREVGAFRTAQQEVENISQSDENIPSYKLLLTDAAPRAGAILKAISAIIDEEETLDATPDRKLLLKYLADTRGSFAVGLANIRAYLLSGNAKFREGFEKKWVVNQARFETIQQGVELFTPTQREHWETYVTKRGEFATLPAKMFASRGAEDWNLANYWLGSKAAPRARAIKGILGKLIESQDRLAKQDREALKQVASITNNTVVWVSLLAGVIGLTVAIVLSRMIVSAVTLLVGRAKEVAAGDLSGQALPIRSQDELGELTTSINEMSTSLSTLVTEVTTTANEVASAATEIAASSEEMSQGMSEQSQQVTQISSAIEQMSASVIEVARKSGDAANNAAESGRAAKEGGEVVKQTIEGMQAISNAVSAGAASVSELGKRGEQIGQIIEVINDIADQTNLLALNAAIEAARAGEHGRGFAVVADEVRKLADRTTKATAEIADSIKAIQAETGEAVEKMNAGTGQVTTGVESATRAGESLKKIVRSAEDVTGMIQSIAAAAEEQSAAPEEVSRTVESVSAVSRQANEGANQAASAATQLSTKAEQLQTLVGRFRT
jgi:methyl-accepting chemotaxis protein